MPNLTLLGASEGFTSGDLDTSGYVSIIPAFQKCYFADGRPYSVTIGDSGYHKLDFLNTNLVGEPSDAFTKGEILTQAISGAIGIFDETVGAGATAKNLVYRTSTIEFDITNEITGGTSAHKLTPTAVNAPPHWLNWIPSTADTMPDGGSNIGCLCFGRIFLNSMLNPHQWWASAVFDPLDFNTAGTGVGAATTSQNAKAGEVGDAIVTMIPYKDFYLIWGCANEMWMLQSDPLMGGVNRCLSKTTGIFSPTSYCWDDKNNLYFIGSDGVYRLSSEAIINAQPPENITKQYIPKLITELGLNRRTDRIAMGYDKQRYGIQISVTQMDGLWSVCWWLDLRTGGLFPDIFAIGQSPASIFYFNSYKSSERGLLFGGYDGYIRKLDEVAKNDEGSNTIRSWVTVGPFTSGKEPRKTIGMNETSLVLGEDSDGVTVDIYKGKSADQIAFDVVSGSTPLISKTLIGDSLKNSIRDKVGGRAIAVKIGNTLANSTFSMEEINLNISEEGREK